MNPRDERSGRDKTLRRLANRLGALGFKRSKSTFFVREAPFVIEFIHLHKFTYRPGFRIHAGLRVLADSFEAPVLNGPDSDVYLGPDSPNGRRYTLSYSIDDESVDRCADQATAWCSEVAEAWFVRWRALDDLLTDSESPLSSTAKAALSEAIAGIRSLESESRSRELLGLSPSSHHG